MNPANGLRMAYMHEYVAKATKPRMIAGMSFLPKGWEYYLKYESTGSRLAMIWVYGATLNSS